MENLPGATNEVYSVTRQYVRDEGLVQVPVAADAADAECKIVRLSAPFETLRVEWVAQRYGAPPSCPDPASLVDNHVLLRREVGAALPTLDNTGDGHTWIMTGVYIYALKKPNGVTPDVPTGRVPFDHSRNPADTNIIPASTFSKNILGSK